MTVVNIKSIILDHVTSACCCSQLLRHQFMSSSPDLNGDLLTFEKISPKWGLKEVFAGQKVVLSLFIKR